MPGKRWNRVGIGYPESPCSKTDPKNDVHGVDLKDVKDNCLELILR